MRAGGIRYVGLRSWDRVGVVLCVGVGLHAYANIRLSCAALPLGNSPGASITCVTKADLAARIAAVCPLLWRLRYPTDGIV